MDFITRKTVALQCIREVSIESKWTGLKQVSIDKATQCVTWESSIDPWGEA